MSVENLRFLLVVSLVLVGSMLWQAWEQDYGVAPVAPSIESTDAGAPVSTADAPPPAPHGVPAPTAERIQEPTPAGTGQDGGRVITVRTDVYSLKLSTRGAGIRHAELLRYPVRNDRPDEPLVLLDDTPERLYLLQGGILAGDLGPTHEALYDSAQDRYELAAGQQTLVVPFTWSSDGVMITKEYEFERGSYVVRVRYRVENRSGATWAGRTYAQIQRVDPGRESHLIYTYTGAVFSSPEKRYEKVSFDDMLESRLERDVSDGWLAMLQHYFVTALIPGRNDVPYRYYTSSLGDGRYAAGLISPAVEVAAGAEGMLEERLFIGPKLQELLESTAEGLDLTVDYGKLWFLAKPLFVCLVWLHGITGNWGWAIILVTVLLKIVFYRLSAAGYRSMANMRRVQPRLKSLQERYKEDRARLNQAMMQLYKEEKINPFGGCLPILIQIPVFIALYWVLLESVEMRQAPFILWIRDLSSPDPYWVLPIVMGVTMFIQQKLNPAPTDPVQEKVMQIMPFAFTIFFGFFPAGLVLYWVANNILSIGQQWLITRSIEQGARQTN